MLIGIDASRAFVKNRTGIEEYSYQVIRHLVDKLDGHEVVLYISTNYELNTNIRITNIEEDIKNKLNLPKNWKVKIIKWPRFWTQIGLSLEMFFHPVEVLFVPAHTVPIIHPDKTIVTVHGLEYEFCPEAYSWWEKFYMRRVIKNSCRWASKIIAVSRSTKRDLKRLYKVPEEKIEVIYEGYEKVSNIKYQISNINSKFQIPNFKFLLFIGRLEKRKNIIGIIKAFEILKEKFNVPHKLVLVGGKGYGFKNAKIKMQKSKYRKDIVLTGFVSDEEKWELLKEAEVFLFPTFYEGFGLPILEAQSVGTPVVASDNSSIPEISANYYGKLHNKAGEFYGNKYKRKGKIKSSVLLVNSHKPQEITEATWRLISDKYLREDVIERGYGNIKRFNWKKCAEEIAEILRKKI